MAYVAVGSFLYCHFTKRRYNFHPNSAPSSSPALVEMIFASFIDGLLVLSLSCWNRDFHSVPIRFSLAVKLSFSWAFLRMMSLSEL